MTDPPPEGPNKREFRAVWVATYHNIDWPSTRGLSTEKQQKEYLDILNQQHQNGMNALVVQIRPCGDAFYQSKFSQWSEWLTGTQGQAPKPFYDPLQFMITETHERNMEFHGWMNPFRAISHDRFSSVSQKHITHKRPEWFFKYGPKTFFNPGIPEVRDYLVEIIAEVVRNYDVDGIHFDDYFYPYQTEGDLKADYATFRIYGRGFNNIHDWRRHNINLFVKQVHDRIRSIKPHVKFGISPIGIWRNQSEDPEGSVSEVSHTAYDGLYADVRKWLKEGWIDYVAPQLYWSTKHPYANYARLLPWWAENAYDRHLYVGHAMFKVKKDLSRHWDNPTQLNLQLKMKKAHPQVNGSIFYSANSFKDNPHNMNRAFRRGHFRFPALIPAMTWKDSIPPLAPTKIKVMQFEEEIAIIWETPTAAEDGETPSYYVIYRFEEGAKIDLENSSSIVSIQKNNTFRDRPREMHLPYTYVVTSVDRLHNESIISTSIKVKFDVGNLNFASRSKNVKIIELAPELEWAVSQTLFRNFPLIDRIKRPKELEVNLTGK